MIHFSKIIPIAERKDSRGAPVPFSLKYVKKSTGELITLDNCVLTSSHHSGTINIKLLDSGQVRKLIIPLIVEFNKTPVYL
jgi:hypothetical protein